MNNNLFRKKSIDRVSSPEQLNDYIRVSNPSIWIVLLSVIILLASVMVWGFFGKLTTTVSAKGIAQNGAIVCYLSESDAAKVKVGMQVDIDQIKGRVAYISETPVSLEKLKINLPEYKLPSMKLSEWNYVITITAPSVPMGVVNVSIITDSVRPISFVFN